MDVYKYVRGETRALGPFDEASSYFRVADAMHMFQQPQRNESLRNLPGAKSVRSRTTTETFATDSFQNLYVLFCAISVSAFEVHITTYIRTFQTQRLFSICRFR